MICAQSFKIHSIHKCFERNAQISAPIIWLLLNKSSMKRTLIVCLVFVCQQIFSSKAMWMLPETVNVPATRIITNLTVKLQSDPNDFETLHALARLHSLEYASGASTNFSIPVGTNRVSKQPQYSSFLSNGVPWFGHGPALPPRPWLTATNLGEASKKDAKKHLLQALLHYEHLAVLNPTNAEIRIGLGWCQLQAGETNKAIEALRRGVALSWKEEKSAHQSLLRPRARENISTLIFFDVTAEAIGYLKPLLDPVRDKNELQKLAKIEEEDRKMPRAITPLALPLLPNLTPAELVDHASSIRFDLDGSGFSDRSWEWINTNAAWIVYLPHENEVTSALQMFGNVTFWMFWENGYHALASLDDNHDGQLSGDELRGIALWQDRNSDGKSTADEIISLQQLGITSLSTSYADENGVLTAKRGASFADGTTCPTYDLILKRKEHASESMSLSSASR